jgi:coenzyme F420 hydrogenase subunit beta
MNIPKVIDEVVNNDFCIGCGLCVYKCPSKALQMRWNEFGFLVPSLARNCDSHGDCLIVCPFNPLPKTKIKTEDELANLFLTSSANHHEKIGRYLGIYAGHSKEFRMTSSSGGIATFIFTELLEKGLVEHVFSVKPSSQPDSQYEYAVSSTKEELLVASKTRYFPVTLATVLPKIHELEGRVAIAGVACFIKAIRLNQFYEPELKNKIPFLAGIICGGVKSRFFTEYLAGKAGVEPKNILNPEFRIKDTGSAAGDYSFECSDKKTGKRKSQKMRTVGDMWGTGLFKANACDFCDDVTTELADISMGDAWLSPYIKDGRGTSVIVTRSSMAERLIKNGVKEGKLTIEELPLDRFLGSQQGSFNHRHKGLSVRIKQAKKKNQTIPPKRFEGERVSLDFKIVQKFRMKVRRKSLEAWTKHPDAKSFDYAMKKYLKLLKLVTRIYHYKRTILSRIR